MHRHYHKKDFPALGLAVIAFEVMSFITFIVGAAIMVYGMMINVDANELILTSFTLIVSAFFLFAIGEFLQLLMKIEVNTRKTDKDMMKLIKDMEKEIGKKIHKH